jgi:hypothetical protein
MPKRSRLEVKKTSVKFSIVNNKMAAIWKPDQNLVWKMTIQKSDGLVFGCSLYSGIRMVGVFKFDFLVVVLIFLIPCDCKISLAPQV